MDGGALRRIARHAAVAGALLLLACAADSQPDTGARVEVTNGDDAESVPQYLLFDWSDNHGVRLHDHRAPESGRLEETASPLAVIRIAATDLSDPERVISVRGMIAGTAVSMGTAAVRLTPGTWTNASVELRTTPTASPDAGTAAADTRLPDARRAD